jgi:predicted Co/Zn/Cd cation transporter (cation efflux family)
MKADLQRRAWTSLKRYETTRWLVMTAVALAVFLGFQFLDAYVFGP